MKITLLFCLLLCAGIAFGQASYWEELPSPPGGTPERITQVANGWVYAEYYDSTVYYSQDNGLNWQQMFWPSNDPDTGFAKITVGRAGTLFAERRVVDNNFLPYFFDVFTSVDNGATWQLLLDSTNIHGLGETSTGYWFGLKDTMGLNFISYQLVVRSDNAGVNWQTVNSLNNWPYFYERVDVGGYDEVWVGRGDYIDTKYYSRDNGNTWVSKLVQSPSSTSIMLTFSNTLLYNNFNQVCRAPVVGTTVCSNIDSAFSNGYGYVNSFFQLPDSSLYATTSQFLYKSVDDGISWQRVGPNNGMVSFHDDRPLFDGTWLASNGYTQARSADLGVSWNFSAFGVNRGLVQDLFLRNEQEWLAWTGSELWHTNNAGQDWELRLDKSGRTPWLYLVENMMADANANTWLVVRDSLLFSPDMGQTFQNITPPAGLSTHIPSQIGLNGQQNTLFVGTQNGTMRTQNNGQTWDNVLDSLYLRKIVHHPSGVLFGLFDSVSWWFSNSSYELHPLLFRSNDDGDTWERLSDQKVEGLIVTPAGDLFAFFPTTIHRSTDMGSTWVSVQQYGNQLISDAGGFLFLFQLGSEKAYMSVDDGHNWQGMPVPNAIASSIWWFLGFDDQSRLFASGWEYAGAGSHGRLFRTTNPTHSGAYLNGTVFKDADGDCSTNDPESLLENWIVRADGNDSWWANTDSSGRYSLFLDTGAYFLTVKPALEPALGNLCRQPAVFSCPTCRTPPTGRAGAGCRRLPVHDCGGSRTLARTLF
jgi:photosystem II stability/assembly factor-like uncharacterized protein